MYYVTNLYVSMCVLFDRKKLYITSLCIIYPYYLIILFLKMNLLYMNIIFISKKFRILFMNLISRRLISLCCFMMTRATCLCLSHRRL